MKKSILLLLATLGTAMSIAAQDLIVKTDSSRIEARVTEITPEAVRYKRFSNPDGPSYVLPITQIGYIRYANGEREVFAVPAAPVAAAPAASAPHPTTVTAAGPVQYVVKQYQIGDYYEADGLKGVICQLNQERTHGLLVSMEEIYLHWSSFRKPDLRVVGADDSSSGQANMEKVAAYIAANNLSWDDFPAFKWCRELGEGWYLPSIDELLTIGHNYNGGTRMSNNRQARNKFNDTLKENGGKRMDRMVFYFSSTERNEKEAMTTHMGIEPPYVIDIPKYNKFIVRAVHKF